MVVKIQRELAESLDSINAYALVRVLQFRLLNGLTDIARNHDSEHPPFSAIEWLRDTGVHGGGIRYSISNSSFFNQASMNVSQVHFDDSPMISLGSVTAISVIIHPLNPFTPSLHFHICWTESKFGQGTWRLMFDLNPSIENRWAKSLFIETLKEAAPEQYEEAKSIGDKYFYIPALRRHRGVAHFFLEDFKLKQNSTETGLAERLGKSVIDCYFDIVEKTSNKFISPKAEDFERQLYFHSVYFFQVLTLDRGTMAGLIVHDQNDLGVLASLPYWVSKPTLEAFLEKMDGHKKELFQIILSVLPDQARCEITDFIRQKIANKLRNYYLLNPRLLRELAKSN
ncbi:MAG: coproporphyrinogen III oxidase [Methylococcales bacterium]|jgi:coproporphyrinogen III oxidase|nr:coproporphyrinogen III oxidase [Methylococcales bacterium]